MPTYSQKGGVQCRYEYNNNNNNKHAPRDAVIRVIHSIQPTPCVGGGGEGSEKGVARNAKTNDVGGVATGVRGGSGRTGAQRPRTNMILCTTHINIFRKGEAADCCLSARSSYTPPPLPPANEYVRAALSYTRTVLRTPHTHLCDIHIMYIIYIRLYGRRGVGLHTRHDTLYVCAITTLSVSTLLICNIICTHTRALCA